MSTLLHIDASPRGDHSISRKLSAALVENWKKQHADGKVVRRDLNASNLTFVDLEWIMGAFSAPDTHTAAHKKALAISDELVAELLAADHIVIGTPMYNFNVPANLKAWIDHVVRAGRTFKYGPQGPEGLATGKKATIAVASAGIYTPESPLASYDQESPYLKQILGFMGITDVEFILAGGTNDVSQGKVDEKQYLAPFLEEAKNFATA